MAVEQRDLLVVGERLVAEPFAKRLRATLGGGTVLDTAGARVVWEPRRVLPQFAVPEADLRAELAPASGPAPQPPDGDGPLGPDAPFAVHTAAGEALDLAAGGLVRPGAAFRPQDPDLAGLVLLDFDAMTSWWQEEEQAIGHARDPHHRVDAHRSTRSVVVRRGEEVLARSTRAVALFEAGLPARFYVPREDVVAELLGSGTRSVCPYKGWASYWSVRTGDGGLLTDAAWSYEEPLHDAEPARGLVCFFGAEGTGESPDGVVVSVDEPA